jgi:hypothetical protein
MKKIYISPQTQVEEIAPDRFFCTSEGANGASLPGGKANDLYEPLSRRYDIWDDEDFEE